MKRQLFLLWIFSISFCSAKIFAQNVELKPWEVIRAKEARGFDSLLGHSINAEILAKYKPTYGRTYSYDSVIKIENFNKWQHSATVYLLVDREGKIYSIYYYFNYEIPAKVAAFFKDSMWWALPLRTHKNNQDNGARGIQIGTSWHGYVFQDNEYSEISRLFWEQRKPMVKVVYSVGKLSPPGINPCTGAEVYQDIHEPTLMGPNVIMCGDTILHMN